MLAPAVAFTPLKITSTILPSIAATQEPATKFAFPEGYDIAALVDGILYKLYDYIVYYIYQNTLIYLSFFISILFLLEILNPDYCVQFTGPGTHL